MAFHDSMAAWAPQVLSAEALSTHPALSLFQKVLLATDGTVTDLVALFTGEAIQASKLMQSLARGREVALLPCGEDELVLHRRILLQGATSGRSYLYAESSFVFDLFPEAVRQGLLHTEQPIGLLWREARLEMYREITDRRIEHCPAVVAHFGLPATAPLLSRTYAIHHDGRQLGVITEKFPAQLLG